MSVTRIRIGISSCLLGESVRYDGGHKRDAYLVRTLGRYVEFVPVCPEMGIGLGVPRAPIQLVGRPDAPRARGRDDPTLDVTNRLAMYGRKQAERLADVSGYIFKSRSPSCGLEHVPVHTPGRTRGGRGVYASALLARQPWLPATEETGLTDPDLRDNFLERVFAYRRWQTLLHGGIGAAQLADFHAAHKYALMAHSPRAVAVLGRVVAHASRRHAPSVAQQYMDGFMAALAVTATPARHENVLLHLAGYLRGHQGKPEQHALLKAISEFRAGRRPRANVLSMLRRQFRRHPDPYIARQTYLYPEAPERRLRKL